MPILFRSTLVALAVALAGPALAQTTPATTPARVLGGCNAAGTVCAGPSATLTVVAINVTRGTIEPAFSPGVGYGITFHPGAWYAYGLDGYLSIDPGPAQRASAALIVKAVGGWFRVGVSRDFIGASQAWRIPIGIGLDF